MYAFTRAFISFLFFFLTLTTVTAAPTTLKECHSDRPCFLVHNFEKAIEHDGVTYELDISFPNEANVSTISYSDLMIPKVSWSIVPATRKPIRCHGVINVPSWHRKQGKPYDVCESVDGSDNPTVHTKFEYHHGQLNVTYVYYGVVAGRLQKFVYTGMRGALNGKDHLSYREFDMPAVGGPAHMS